MYRVGSANVLYQDNAQRLSHASCGVCVYVYVLRYYTLTFSLRCMYDNDLVHVAHCYPYTYTDLQTYLKVGPYCLQTTHTHSHARELAPALMPNFHACANVMHADATNHAPQAVE